MLSATGGFKMLNGLQNFLQLINDNWTTIIVIISLIFALFKKIQSYLSKSNDEKIAIVKNQVQQTILKLMLKWIIRTGQKPARLNVRK